MPARGIKMDIDPYEKRNLFLMFLASFILIPAVAAVEAIFFGTDYLWFIFGLIYGAFMLYRSWKSMRF
jgi:hypothetical protein